MSEAVSYLFDNIDNPLAGIVLYKPQKSTEHLVDLIKSQGCDVCAVINGNVSEEEKLLLELAAVKLIIHDENVGLAVALNDIISYFLESENTHLFLFDQDSLPSPDFVFYMLEKFNKLEADVSNIACLVPSIQDSKIGVIPHKYLQRNKTTLQTAMTSGCLFSKASFNAVGSMDDSLFIDGIDHEWCFRAQSLGMKIYLCEEAILYHSLGDISVMLGASRKQMHKNPIRHYYIVRNSFYLARKKYIPWRWRLIEMLKTCRRAFAYPLMGKSFKLSLKMVFLGIMHGLMRRTGKLNKYPH